MLGVYLNNAATSYPKPDVVYEATVKFLKYYGMNLGRGSTSEKEVSTIRLVFACRENIIEFFSTPSSKKIYDERLEPHYVTFTSNVTEALNTILKGYLKSGMRVLTSGIEHNAVVRPLRRLETIGVKVDIASCSESGELYPETVANMIKRSNYDLMVMSHASNVCGTIQNIADISSICYEAGVPFVLDAAQTAGVIPIDVNSLRLSALCFTGHKGLMGPQGIGGIVWGRTPDGVNFSSKVDPLIDGGTGSYSHVEIQPDEMPDKFESGTLNLPGIVGLNTAINWINKTGIEKIAAHERELCALLLSNLGEIPGLCIYGKQDTNGRMPVVSFNIMTSRRCEGTHVTLQNGFYDNGILAGKLSTMGFETRPGLHCSPFAHKTLGSFPEGSLRVSPGYFNTREDIEGFVEVLKRIIV
jgi:cysteine desulfurase family protein